MAVKRDNKWGYVDREKEIIIDFLFEELGYFSDGLACVREGDKWVFIGRDGVFVTLPQFESVLPFRDGMATV